nr:acyl-CoA thioesterase [Bacteroidales bacterium]
IEIDNKTPQKTQDFFGAKLSAGKEGNVRIIFHQWIERIPDGKLMIDAKITGVCLKNGRPVRPEEATGIEW